ncbi:VENN motif pre-toxin domain-containing protein [Stenotrophomonas sp. MYb57]|uniref:VENN motif pre-toxin domain-containing protein n=1 Tax=Stenotrophomonas sp. MYb57 TaxID=1827305 RepID=UPI001F396985|nr:VENN motif pre-toxin domain-containing protein [Stenotrophomonas sp. MYb57]
MSRNSQVGGRVQVAFGNAWNADGYASAGKAEGSYQGVGQQSGLFAGNGGYHVDAGHVNLIGGAISSTNAANSELTAQTLTFSDLQNQMDYSASSGSISGGAGGQMKGWDPKAGTTVPRGGPGMSMTENGSDSSSTLATLTEGNITIGGKQTTAAELGINTDASAAHRALEAMPDASKLLADQQAMAAAAGTVLSTSRQISGDLASRAQADAANAYDGFVESLEGQDLADFQALDAKGEQNYVLSHSADYRNFYRSQLQWGIGGDYSRALGAVTTALIGGASGQGASQIVGNALAPYAAQLIGEKFDASHGSDPNAVAQALSHALLGAVLAELNGGSASVGAVAGAGGEIAAGVLMQAFPYADKETISALSQAVGALAGGAAGGDLAQIALNMGISKNAVENNRLLNVIELARIKELSNGDVVREAELTAAACALVKCSAGFAEGSVERAEWAAIEALGSTPEALDDRQWLKVQVQPGCLYTAGNGVATQEQLFDYAFTDYLFDWGSRNQAGVRAFGGLQAVGGAAQAAGGIAVSPSCASIIGCVGAGFLIASGYDNAVAGTNTLFTGKPTATWGGQAFQAAGISPDVAELLYALSQVGAASAVSIPKAGPRPSTPAPTESHAVEPPGRQVPVPRIDVTNEFLVNKSGRGTTLRYGDPDGVAGLIVNVDRSGVLGFDIRSAVDHPLYQASGTDMFASAMRRLAKEGVEVNKVRGAWVGGTDSVNADEYLRNVANGMSKEGATMNAWTGRIAQKYGYKNVEKIEEVGSVAYVAFGK